MSKTARILLGVGLLLLIATVLLFGTKGILTKAGPTPEVSGPGPQISEAGGIQVLATFSPAAQKQETLAFDVALTTHSVELGAFELAKLSRVVLDPGGSVTELRWEPKGATSGHHIEGTLTAQVPTALNGVKTVALEIEGLGSPEVRRFEWTTGAR